MFEIIVGGNVSLIDKCPTGIAGIDNLLGGGFPRGNIILLAGTPGAGKTTFAAKFIYEGAKRYGEPGIYLSFLESKYDFYRYMKALGMDFEELERRGLFTYIEGVQTQSTEGIEESLKEFLRLVIESNAKRAVIDSVTAIIQLIGFRGAREILKNAIIAGLKPLNVTTLLIAELAIGNPNVGFGVEEFLVDGVILLRSIIEGGELIRRMEIRKMRGSDIPRAEVYFDIVPSEAIRVYLQERIEEIPAPSEEVTYEVPIREFTHIFGPILRKGTQIALITQESSAGLAIALSLMIPFIMRYGGRLLIRSFSKSPSIIESLICDVMKALGYKDRSIDVHIESLQSTYRPIYVLGYQVRETDTKLKPDFTVIDSLNQIPVIHGWKDFISIHSDMVLTRRRLKITSIYIYYERRERPLPIPLDIYDKIIKVRPEIEYNCYVMRSFVSGVNHYLRPIKVCFTEKGIKWSVTSE